MTWTRQQYIENWPDSPNPYSSSDEPCKGGQLVDDGAVLRAMDAHDKLMEQCICDYDGGYGDDGSQVRRFAKPGCPVHLLEDHDCQEHLDYREHEAVEPHGERHRDCWYECTVCGEKFSVEELEKRNQ